MTQGSLGYLDLVYNPPATFGEDYLKRYEAKIAARVARYSGYDTSTPQLTCSFKYASLQCTFRFANMTGTYMGLFHLLNKMQFRFVPGQLAFKLQLYAVCFPTLLTAPAIGYPALAAHGTDTLSTSSAFAAIYSGATKLV